MQECRERLILDCVKGAVIYMHGSMKLLDLDDRASWLEPYSLFAKSDVLWQELEEFIQVKDEIDFCRLLTQLG